MSASNRLPWLRIGVEGVAIVVSILLAFSIEAWWSEKQDRGEEQGALNGLRSDFLASRSGLASVIATLEAAQARFARFQNSTPEELAGIASDSTGLMVNAFIMGLTYDPVLTTIESAASDGRLSLIRDPDLRQSLATWLRALEDIEENEVDIRSQALRVVRSSERHGGPFHNSALSEGSGVFLPRADGSTLAALRSDSAFVAHVRSHHYTIAFYLRELVPLAQVIDSTLGLIDANIR